MKDQPQPHDLDGNPVTPGLPMAMLAEITHRCPLACPYCSNPVELTRAAQELDAATWARIFRQAADLGVLQVHISGGEPGARRDLAQIVASAREAGLYVNLITSGIGITQARLRELDAAGVDHVQLSLQGIQPDMANRISGHPGSWDKKMGFAEWVTEIGFPPDHQRRRAPPEHGSPARDDRAGRNPWRAPDRGCDRAVPRLGRSEPRQPDANPRTGGFRAAGRQ